jgi:hypothetical protein
LRRVHVGEGEQLLARERGGQVRTLGRQGDSRQRLQGGADARDPARADQDLSGAAVRAGQHVLDRADLVPGAGENARPDADGGDGAGGGVDRSGCGLRGGGEAASSSAAAPQPGTVQRRLTFVVFSTDPEPPMTVDPTPPSKQLSEGSTEAVRAGTKTKFNMVALVGGLILVIIGFAFIWGNRADDLASTRPEIGRTPADAAASTPPSSRLRATARRTGTPPTR